MIGIIRPRPLLRAFVSWSRVPLRFGGQWGCRTDNELGLVRMGYRDFYPKGGVFLSRDPIGYAGGMSLSTLCQGDPVNQVDPLGLDQYGPGYWSQAWSFFKGELSVLNPVNAVKSIWSADLHIYAAWRRDGHPIQGLLDVGAEFADGLGVRGLRHRHGV